MIGLAYSPVILYIFLESVREQPRGERRKDRISTLLLGAALCLMVACPTLVFLSNGFPSQHLFFYLGIFIGIAGVWLRWKAMRTLGRFFSRNIGIQQEHRVIDTGFYRFIRHPGYLGTLITFFGFALSTCWWPVVLINGCCFLIAYSYRMHVEEKMLIAFFGSAYRNYQSRTWRLIPLIY
ncbi:MAG: isoprenylcysteine carboxylmethyltransferase family protein [Firmicutes bacterium]|uniref:Protein-S-isoprenylcysteine O-methyltransferase Ste14 n=1 Tax=Melghirimyces thermohalophilus TaxID=1236220 RepID=A0A1G6IZX8_9BACL|nr:isoprenylcysteine carboxylmethyltransferase family protein [Melghirimyces thermohalophilus]MDA8353693.1 isoprenylcysteine carboxylmethyltransferase family protein [Bacillota bacterium]SDC11346.1 Protein-S-isoprenylcysteine O-methyltransferase Ste14 [Melghirimyces thermohalophilus]